MAAVTHVDRPRFLPPEGGEFWELAADWRVVFNDVTYVIPMGFRTDGASIPRFLWRVCGTPLGVPRLYAAIVHDWLYSGGCPGTTRSQADAVYRDMQIAMGVSKFKAYVEWSALRCCGGSHWEGDKR